MAKCLEDGDKRIADLARMFFTELSTKDNAVYNHFVDMFSLLSADQTIDEDSFKRVMKFLLGFVEKVSPWLYAAFVHLLAPQINKRNRTNTLGNWQRSSLPVYHAATRRGSGTTLRTH